MIDGNNAKMLFAKSSPEWQAVLIENFGKDHFNLKITERIKTFADACEFPGIDPVDVYDSSEDSDVIAYKKLKVVVRALNEGWEPNWNDSNQRKWYPWWYMNQPGFRLYGVFYGYTYSRVGSRLVFKTEELAKHAAEYFSGLYSDYYEL